MKIEDAINELVSYMKKVYEQINNKVGQNIYRGHLRSISTDIEDGIALFLSKILPEGYKLFLDSSIHVDGVNFRPDVLVVNDKNECYAMIEIKANMGWCRDATNVINDIVSIPCYCFHHKPACNGQGKPAVYLITIQIKGDKFPACNS